MQISLGTSSFNQAALNAANDWSAVGAAFQYVVQFASGQPSNVCSTCGPQNYNPVFFANSVCGLGFGDIVAQANICWDQHNNIVNGPVFVNSTVSWGVYDGPFTPPINDLHRVLLHEFGHVVGLDHPNQLGQTVAAIMNSGESDTDSLQADDRAGILSLYANAAPTPTPTPRIQINIGSARGGPGENVDITVSLAASGASVAATANDITFDSGALSLNPAQCQVNPEIGKSLSAGAVGSGWVRVFVQAKPNTSAIPDGPLYTCRVSIAAVALPRTYPLANGNTAAFSPAGAQLSGVAGADGSVVVSLVPQACTGDCKNNRQVTVADILTMVNIALGNAILSDCEAGDTNGDGQITVDEILQAVNNALNVREIGWTHPVP